MSQTSDRREFLDICRTTAAAAAVAGYTATASGYAANETLGIGCVGTGGRCRHLMQSIPKIAGAKIVAVADVWDDHLEAGRKLADPKAAATKDFRELLDRKDVDAVLIATPDHWHVPATIAACEAGKDVYVEKPLTHDLSEGRAVLDAQKKSGRIVQVGTQQRSMPHYQKANEIVRSGQIGKVFKAHLTWNRNQPRNRRVPLGVDPKSVDWKRFVGSAPDQPFDEFKFRAWRWFWDFGGGLFTDLMVHQIDIVHMILDLDHPALAASIGTHFSSKDAWETPDTVQTLLTYPEQELQVYYEGTFSNARHGEMIELMGTDATLYLDRGRYEIHPERGRKIKYTEEVIGTGPRGADFYDKPDGELLHLSNWIQCIRDRKQPNSPAQSGVSAASAAHLANIALRKNQVAKWEEAAPG